MAKLTRERGERRFLPGLKPGLHAAILMKPQNSHDRAIAERVQARARTADGSRLAAGLWRSFGADGYDLRADGPRLAAPALLVWGARDTILPLKAGRQARAAIPGAQFRTLDTGHVVFASDPSGFLDLTMSFIESVLVR